MNALLLVFILFANWSTDTICPIDRVKQWKIDDRIVYVKGTINRLDDRIGFYLADDTGEIRVEFTNYDLGEYSFKAGSLVEVRGKIERRTKNTELKATAVKLSDGTLIGSY